MQVAVTVDLGFGDSGKGTIVDALVRRMGASLVVRTSGGAQCSRWLLGQGARPVAFDLSMAQLAEARRIDAQSGTAVPLESVVAAELDAAVGNALDNVTAHAGPQARAFVLLEDLGDTVTVTVRDDGAGIPAGRLEQAVREGRVGVSKSIVGRLYSLGGSASLSTDDTGTEWELSVPRVTGG